MSSSATPLWWDRDIDRTGRPIRPDVRAAAHGIWDCACRRAYSLIDDCSQAAELMESSVAQVSRYLDRESVLVFSRELDGLLMCAFRRALYRRATKLNRLEVFCLKNPKQMATHFLRAIEVLPWSPPRS